MDKQLREDLQLIINEDVTTLLANTAHAYSPVIASLAAMGIILIPALRRAAQRKKQAKEKCQKYSHSKSLMKKCILKGEIDAIKQERNAIISAARNQCNKKTDPEKRKKCISMLNGLATDKLKLIKKKEAQMRAL
jgi:hypothetical protein